MSSVKVMARAARDELVDCINLVRSVSRGPNLLVVPSTAAVTHSDAVMSPAAPMALRMSSILMSGIVLLYQKQQHYLLEDFSTFVTRVKDAMRMQATDKNATLNKKQLRAKYVSTYRLVGQNCTHVFEIAHAGRVSFPDPHR